MATLRMPPLTPTRKGSMAALVDHRLPANIVPLHYALSFALDMASARFSGSVSVSVLCSERTRLVVLHACDLWIRTAALTPQDKTKMVATCATMRAASQTLELEFPLYFEPGHGTLTIEFEGKLNDQLRGWYRAGGGSIAVTQFEATDARRCFPCWDEPARKATFQVTVTTQLRWHVLSNTRAINISQTDSGERRWTFATTPKMSTYLLAMVVGEFDMAAHTSSKSGVETLCYTPRGKSSQAAFALDVAASCLDLFIELFGPYPLRLQQHVAIPDFAAGAMENWGLITYREARLLADKNTSMSGKRDCARVVCHEISHQWFGNLVTMQWWSDLWLNEGFARLCEFIALDKLDLGLGDPWEVFDGEVLGAALRLDSLKSSHPIRVEVGHPDEISEIFDAVSYAKGASVLRMLTHHLGGLDVFLCGVRLYLQRFAYKNAEASDLWHCLEEGAGVPAGELVNLMTAWTTVTGYPLISVSDDGKLTQTRYLSLGPASEADDAAEWTVPLQVVSPLGLSSHLVTPGSDDAATSALESQLAKLPWFCLNARGDLFRVAYTERQWKALFANMAQLPGRGRLLCTRDAFDLAESGHVKVSLPLALAGTLMGAKESHIGTVLLLLQRLSALENLYRGAAWYDYFVASILKPCVEPLWCELGWTGSAWLAGDRLEEVRAMAARCASVVDRSVCNDAERAVLDLCARGAQPSKELRPVLLRLAATGSTSQMTLMAAFEKRFAECNDAMEQRELLSAMGAFTTPEVLNRAMVFCFDTGSVKSQDVPIFAASLGATSSLGASTLHARFVSDFDSMLAKYGAANFLWSNLVGAVVGNVDSQRAEQVAQMFEARPDSLGSAKRALDQAIEKVKAREAQLLRDSTGGPWPAA